MKKADSIGKEEATKVAKLPTARPSVKAKFSEKEVLAAIDRCQGLTSPLMRALDCTYS